MRACGWASLNRCGLNEGPIVLVIRNYWSGLVWRLTQCGPYLVTALPREGLRGGWLE